MDALSLTPWKCTIYSITHLANAVVYSPGVGVLEITLEDIDSQAKYLLKFTEVLGYRFEAHFNEQNLVNTFKVEDSAWIKAIETKPFRTKNIESIQHYLISTMCGEFQVVCLTEPAIELIE